MTFINRQSGIDAVTRQKQSQAKPPGVLNNFLEFLQSPEASGLSQGLLAASQPSMTMPTQNLGGALGQGLALGKQYRTQKEKQELEQAQHELEKLYKTGMLDIHQQELAQSMLKHQQELAQRKVEHEANHGLKREELDLEGEYKQAQIGKLLQEAEQRKAQQAFLSSVLSGDDGNGGGSTSPLEGLSDEQRKRAATLAGAGFTEEAFKVLTEKNPENSPTKTTLTNNQQVAQAVDNVIPQIDDLLKIDVPFQTPNIWGAGRLTSLWSPAKQADYEAKVAGITDQLVNALNLPKTNESIHLVEKMVRKQPNEGDASWHKRLKHLKGDLKKRQINAYKIAPPVGADKKSKKQSLANKPASDYSVEELEAIANGED